MTCRMLLRRLKPHVERILDRIIRKEEKDLSHFKYIDVNGVVTDITLEVSHTPLVDMLDVSIFIENLYMTISEEDIVVDVLLSTSFPIASNDYTVEYVDVLKCKESEAYTDNDVAEAVKSDWNNS